MIDNRSKVIMAKSKQIRDNPILIAECLDVRETILMTSRKGLQRISIQTVNFINGKIEMPKDIINLVEDVKCSLAFGVNRMKYFNRIFNKDVYVLSRKTHL